MLLWLLENTHYAETFRVAMGRVGGQWWAAGGPGQATRCGRGLLQVRVAEASRGGCCLCFVWLPPQ